MQTGPRSIAAIAVIVTLAYVDSRALLADSPAGPPFPPVAETADYLIEVLPAAPTHSERVALRFTKKPGAPCGFSLNGVLVDQRTRVVLVSIETNNAMFTGCPAPDVYTVPIGRLPDTAYGVVVYNEGVLPSTPLFDEENRVADIYLEVSEPSARYNAEVPAEGSVQSGVGMVRGWACDAKTVQVQFDDMPLIDVAYGTSREDTRAVCDDAANGYGMVMNWGLLDAGFHRMRTFIDGREVADVSFEVTGLDEEFIKGLSGTYRLDDFPHPGDSVDVEWSESAQNFIIVR